MPFSFYKETNNEACVCACCNKTIEKDEICFRKSPITLDGVRYGRAGWDAQYCKTCTAIIKLAWS